MSRERRVHPRWELHTVVDLQSDDNLYTGLSNDVSAGGIFVATLDTPPIGTEVQIKVTLLDGTVLDLTGVTRWVRGIRDASHGLPAGCGIEWHDLPAEALVSLMRFAQQRDPLFYEV
jgi:Tfp pilus assembly protein PilZ